MITGLPPKRVTPDDSLMAQSLMSAVGSVPLHVAPILIAAAVAEGVRSVDAALLASVLLAGQAVAAIGLTRSERANAAPEMLLRGAITGLLSCLLALALEPAGALTVHALWFAVGLASGAAIFVGIKGAAVSQQRHRLFALRLSSGMMLSSVVLILFWVRADLPSSTELARIMLVASVAYLVALRGFNVRLDGQPRSFVAARPKVQTGDLLPLAVVSLFYVGSVGLLSNVLNQGLASDTDARSAALYFGIVKMLVGGGVAVSFVLSRPSPIFGIKSLFLCYVGSAIALVSVISPAPFTLALLAFDTTLNLTAVLLLSATSAQISEGGRTALFAAILAGSAVGPILFAALLERSLNATAMSVFAASVGFAFYVCMDGGAKRTRSRGRRYPGVEAKALYQGAERRSTSAE